MNRTEVLEALEPLNRVRVRQVNHQENTRVIVTPDMVELRPGGGGHMIPLNEAGQKALANFAGIPQGIQRKVRPETYSRLVTELLSHKERYNVLLDGEDGIDFTEYQGVRPLNTERVVTTIEQNVRGAEFFRVTVAPAPLHAIIEVVGEKREPVVRGDMVRAGALVRFSSIGAIKPSVQSYVMQLVCTNGQTANHIVREFAGGGGEGDDIWQWFRESIRAAYGSLAPIIGRFRQMRDERIPPDQRAMMLEALLREAHITGPDAEAVRAQAIAQPPRNTYELMNLITWASSHVIADPVRVQHAMNTTANFASAQEHARLCPLCHSRRPAVQVRALPAPRAAAPVTETPSEN